jgi:hypothetical protein
MAVVHVLPQHAALIIIIITQDYTADKAIGPGELLRCDTQTPEYCLWHPAGISCHCLPRRDVISWWQRNLRHELVLKLWQGAGHICIELNSTRETQSPNLKGRLEPL